MIFSDRPGKSGVEMFVAIMIGVTMRIAHLVNPAVGKVPNIFRETKNNVELNAKIKKSCAPHWVAFARQM